MRLEALMSALPLARLTTGDPEITSVVTDSRQSGPGALFFAREGWFVDSHRFIPQAVAAGAAAVVVTRPEMAGAADGAPVFRSMAEDRDLALICDRFFGEPTAALRVFGVTGTNGKTSVAYLLEHMLQALGERVAVIGTVSHRFEDIVIPARNTTPDGLTIHGFARRALDAGATCLVLEVSSHGAALGRIAGVAFDAVGFTNLTPEHLDFHQTLEAYREAKALLFDDYLAASVARGKAVHAAVWRGDPESATMAARAARHGRVVSVGPDPSADIAVTVDERLGVDGVRLSVQARGASASGRLPLVGEHNVANAAVALGMLAGTHPNRLSDAVASLESFAGIPGRFERAYDARFGPACFVDYAHTADAVERAVDVVVGLGGGPTTVVLGCGGDRDRSKRGPMAAAAASRADRTILTSDNPRSEDPAAILDEMEAGLTPALAADVTRIERRDEAVAAAITTAEGPVLLAGKGHESAQEIAGVRYRFDDREEARRAAWARLSGVRADSVPLLAGWSVARIAAAVGGRVVQPGRVGPWGALTTDSRAVADRGIFVALRGERFDGHDFVRAAATGGAGLVVVDRVVDPLPSDCAVVRVDDTLRGLRLLAAAILDEGRGRQGGLRVVGLTGSNGKTTTKELTAAVLGPRALVTPGNLNNHIGLPLTVAALAPRHRLAVLEMGANRPDDIGDLVGIAHPDVGVVTSIGLAHIEGFGDLAGVRRAKSLIAAEGLETLVVPDTEVDLPEWSAARARSRAVVTFGTTDRADVRVERPDVLGPVRVVADGLSFEVALPVPGMHNATNLAASLAAVRALTAELPPPEDIDAALAGLALPGGRLRVLDIGGRTVIDDAYNANPASVAASLRILAEMPRPRVAILGEMLELGPSSSELHREVGRLAAEASDVVVIVGAGASSAGVGAGPDAHVFADMGAAASWVARTIGPNATVLLKASRGAGLEAMIPTLRAAWEGQG